MAYDPVGHEAAITTSGDAQVFGIDGFGSENVAYGFCDVLVIPLAVVFAYGKRPVFSITGGAAWVDVEDGKSSGVEEVEFVHESLAEGGAWAAVNFENGWMLFAARTWWKHDPAFDFGFVTGIEGEAFGCGHFETRKEGSVEAGQALVGFALCPDPDLGQFCWCHARVSGHAVVGAVGRGFNGVIAGSVRSELFGV